MNRPLSTGVVKMRWQIAGTVSKETGNGETEERARITEIQDLLMDRSRTAAGAREY